ncbi:hypothetical protein [Afipia carboxidovorans]|uniref:hypothetical protein n=1 Tax=Afipia carboxidovorans TaxID=40137 RepID=UPI0030932808|nr:hypothetical protein CRBSH125_36630 [Afipia carboxidovorans]
MMCLGRKLIGARSLLALDFLTVIDAFTRDITSIVDQPAALTVNVRGVAEEWKPDYAIAHKDGRRDLVMVRTVKWLMKRDPDHGAWMRDLVDAMTQAAKRAGYGFRLVTEEQIRVQPRLANAKMLRRHLVPYRSPDGEIAAIDSLADLPKESSVAELQARLGERFDAFVLALQLDWLGHLRIDRRVPFGRMSSFVKT